MQRFPTARLSETVLRALVEALNIVDVGIVLLDRDMHVRFINRFQIRIFCLPASLLTTHLTFRDVLNHAGARIWSDVHVAELRSRIDQHAAAVRAGSIPPTYLNLPDGLRVRFTCETCPDGGRILTYGDRSLELRPEILDAMEQSNAELRFRNETMEDHAAQLASLAEATDENARRAEEARLALEREIVERRLLETRLREMATTDGLTGALNRSGFMVLAQNELEREPPLRCQFALMMLDVDHFKSINDRYGHTGGDVALKHLVTTIAGRIRRSDLLGRLGGEEFAILLPGTPTEEAARMAERLVAHVAGSPVMFRDQRIVMTVSIGLTGATPEDHCIERIIARADAALYRAKESGRNKVVKDLEMV